MFGFHVVSLSSAAVAIGMMGAEMPGAASLRQISGSELRNLVVGSSMGYGHPSIRGGNFAIFGKDYHFTFYGRELRLGGTYRIDNINVCVDIQDPYCFTVFVDKKKKYYAKFAYTSTDELSPIEFKR